MTAFVVCLTMAMLAIAGLVIDGGYILAARQRAFDEADAAARAGAQAVSIDDLRSGRSVVIDTAGAQRRVDQYLAGTGHRGTAEVTGDEVVVRITFRQPMVLLDVFGASPVTINAVGHATAVQAVSDPEVVP